MNVIPRKGHGQMASINSQTRYPSLFWESRSLIGLLTYPPSVLSHFISSFFVVFFFFRFFVLLLY